MSVTVSSGRGCGPACQIDGKATRGTAPREKLEGFGREPLRAVRSTHHPRCDTAPGRGDGVSNRPLIRILAEMVEEVLDGRRALKYAKIDEEALPDLQDDVRSPHDVAEVLRPSMQAERRPKAPKAGRR